MGTKVVPDSLTVVIPTFNREVLLKKALEGYMAQSSSESIHELLVVDDGSTDGTESAVLELSRRSPFPIRYLRQPNKGPAAARNLGIREARTGIILFTDSDIVPARNLVFQHLQWHRENPETSVAILGYVTWPPEIKATPFMRWYGEAGPLFAYRQFRNKRQISFHFFYTCNLSLKTEFLRTHGQFDEDFTGAAFEDIELGYRLSKAGLRLLYNPRAVAYHHQYFSFSDACRKAQRNAPAARLFSRKEAGQRLLEPTIRRRSRLSYRIAARVASGIGAALRPASRLLDSHIPLPAIVYRLFFWYYTTRRLGIR